MRSFLLFTLTLFISATVFSQSGVIKGRVFNAVNNDPVPFANIVIQGTATGASSDMDGNYKLENLDAGLYNLEVSFVGFQTRVIYEVKVANSKATFLDIELEEQSTDINEIVIQASPFNKTEESPVSLRTLGVAEIERFPGGNRDISKVIQSLPGVASSASFRNDIIIRGGAPNENRFYLDGIEVPNINHFATQGSSGGPVGMINVNFVNEVDFYSGAFPVNRGNTLSSVFEFKQKDGNRDKLETAFIIGSSDIGLTFDGPISENTTFIFSARRSYLQLIFSALQLPFLPTYNDAQFKIKTNIDEKNQLTFVGLGAIDDFALNTSVNDGIDDPEIIRRNQYILGNIPKNSQWNYTLGGAWKHFGKNGFQTFVLSRNHLNNRAEKYADNDESDPANLLYDYTSEEIENKFRYENLTRKNDWKISYGIGIEDATYTNKTINNIFIPNQGISRIGYSSSLNFIKYAAFGQASRSFLSKRLTTSIGLRTDFNGYSTEMGKPIDQLSPRLSLSYAIAPEIFLNFNTGTYYQLPAYTVMGYRDENDVLVNRENGLSYIRANHWVAGVEFNKDFNTKITVEGFYKTYSNYPFLTNDSVALANLGADFGVIGDAPAVSNSEGRAYGIELLAQRKLKQGFYGILAVTWVKSEFEDKNGKFIPSAWDNGLIITATAGKSFKKNWELGMKWRYLGGAPYTPIDVANSSLISVWNVTGQGLPDYNRLNQSSLQAFHQLDVRLDKRWFYDRWSLNLYLDIQNLYNFQAEQAPYLDILRDANGDGIIDANDMSRYQTEFITDVNGTILPILGVILEF